ncbi:MAG: serine/threonine-protein kinase [Thermomonas sp.]|uniref:serine/threonine-protein kinase n=1 Tax=Thermomonas sp. TaxID=1971895 RepID=UPI001D82790D|nr:serine/threonine-protein kinase [Thermomonas sp.]MBZ0087494.1 serine/threonine-protein kinase [Thermomonas sp.]
MASGPSSRAFAEFSALMDLPVRERLQRLQTLRREDAALADAVERLLAAADDQPGSDDSGERLARWAAHLSTEAGDADALDVGQMLGPWRLLRRLGEGGMGTVWLGEREGDGFRQQAAIKLITHGLDSSLARARFLRERGILAQLEHPNIASLLDGGVSAAGQPYFAMACVEGEPINAWCDGRRLGVRARVTLFLQVLDAVQYAHRNLIVHRDLKPSNVLVDGDGHVKLLDFGIAKLLEPETRSDVTRELAMTPQFAAPEQLRHLPVTTATDVYQLGLMLHLILTGDHPFGVRDATPVGELLPLLEAPPHSLGQVARQLSEATLAQRQSGRKAFVHSVSGDLSAIVATCLAVEPEQRYPSVDALAGDLRRWLDGLPVGVRASSRSYRLRFFVRRHRWALASLAAIICALAIGLGVALQQARQARLQAQRAQQVKDLVLSVFREQDPLARGTDSARAPAQILADGIRGLDARQGVEPALRAELLDDLGEIQSNLGDPAHGIITLQQALALRTQLFGPTSAQVGQTERKLSQAAWAAGNLETAERHARRALAVATELDGGHAPEAARARLALAQATINGRQREQALPMAEQAIADLALRLGRGAPETTAAMQQRALLLLQLRREDEAIVQLRQMVAAIEAGAGAQSPRLLPPLSLLASALRQNHRADEAAAAFERAEALARRYYPEPSGTLANLLVRHGALMLQQRKLPQAKTLFDAAAHAMPAGNDDALSKLLFERGKLHLLLGEGDAAEADLRQAFELQRKLSGDGDGSTWYYASVWGQGLAMQNRFAEAERIQRDAITRLHAILGPTAYQNALLLDALTDTLMRAGRPVEALATMRESLALTASKYSTDHPLYQGRMKALHEIEQAAAAQSASRR